MPIAPGDAEAVQRAAITAHGTVQPELRGLS
ncbi:MULTISPECIES: hypothetical protein [unclassified Pseudomonas]